MKKLLIALGFISAIIATVLSTSTFYSLAITPIIVAFVCGLIVLIISKKQNIKTKTIQYTFLLVIIALGFTIYKGVFEKPTLENPEQLELNEEKTLDNSKKDQKVIDK